MTKLSLLFLSLCTLTAAQPAADLDKRLADLEKAAKAAQSAGDNAWMLTSAALVLMMTGPGLALFYGGLVRRKNVLSTMMHSFVLMAVVSVLWAVVGYSLTFGEGTPFSEACSTCSCMAWERRPTAITQPPSRRALSWCIN
jgi:Amt family ammonium transporter